MRNGEGEEEGGEEEEVEEGRSVDCCKVVLLHVSPSTEVLPVGTEGCWLVRQQIHLSILCKFFYNYVKGSELV